MTNEYTDSGVLPMVSIKCLVYNHAPYLRQCLDGFVMQKTNFKFEAIVHDDCSTDGSQEIIKEYAAKYPDIIKPIFETENQYSKHDGSLRRIVNAHLTGKYIAFCEGDDYWTDPNKLQMQVDYMENTPKCSLCFHNYYLIDIDGSNKRLAHESIKDSYTKEEIFFKYPFHTTTIVIRRNVLNSDMYIKSPLVLSEDTNLFLAATCIGENHGIDIALSCYRMNTGVTRDMYTSKIPQHIEKNIAQLANYYNIKKWEQQYLPQFIVISSYQFRYKDFSVFFNTIKTSLKYSFIYTIKGIFLVIKMLLTKTIIRITKVNSF